MYTMKYWYSDNMHTCMCKNISMQKQTWRSTCIYMCMYMDMCVLDSWAFWGPHKMFFIHYLVFEVQLYSMFLFFAIINDQGLCKNDRQKVAMYTLSASTQYVHTSMFTFIYECTCVNVSPWMYVQCVEVRLCISTWKFVYIGVYVPRCLHMWVHVRFYTLC